MSLSTHVLDSSTGRPAAGIRVRLESSKANTWVAEAEAVTDADGRIREFSSDGPAAGVHRLIFDTAGYFDGRPAFYPEVAVTFQITDPAEHHHVPLLLSPFAYSTYRGS
ncbi:MAG: hydroxyisourate hydrolase [Haloechinothrix sp.]